MTIILPAEQFRAQFTRFQRLIALNGKSHAFTNFREGIAGAWENYKPRLRTHALAILDVDAWTEGEIGSGAILQRTIDAIEIQDSHANLINNLVFWQNRYGHGNRDHRALLEGLSNAGSRRELEGLLFGLYRGGADEGDTFGALSELTHSKYPLLAYLFFLKDMDRFMPIQPTTFDRAFRALGIDLVTLRHCSWGNYQEYNEALGAVRDSLASIEGLSDVRLIDAHSFCWLLEQLDEDGGSASRADRKDAGRILGSRERSIVEMRYAIENTVKNSNGQIVLRTVKNKELLMAPAGLEKFIADLLDVQENRCALTGIPFQFNGPNADKNLLPSIDRIDSNGHYGPGNCQILCRFINFWKGNTDNEEFKRLLLLVMGGAKEAAQ